MINPDRQPPLENWPAILAAVRVTTKVLAPLDLTSRMAVLSALLVQEICTLPPSERKGALRELVDELPDILTSTEEGMRLALVQNAKKGL